MINTLCYGCDMKQNVGEYLLDISKLVFAGVALSAILDIDGISKVAVLFAGVSATITIALIGFTLIRET